MELPRRHLAVLVCGLSLAVGGCGASGDKASAPSGPKAVQISPGGPVAPLRVAVTDARVGDATTASEAGVVELRVPQRKVDPRAVERRASRREGVGAGAACTDRDLIPAADNLPAVQASTLCLLNGERADHGLKPLTSNAKLARAADAHTQDMVSNGYFDHSGRNGSDVVDRIRATGYIASDRAWTVGENLAWGTGTLATPKGIVNAWMNSEGHRANILKAEYREIGFGVVVGNPRSDNGQGATYTANFGTVAGSGGSAGDVAQAIAPTTTTRPGSDRPSAAARKAAAKRKAAKRKAAKRKRRAKRARLAKRRAAAARRRAAAARRR